MKDRLQLRYDQHLYGGFNEIKAVLDREKAENLLNWALKGEPIVFFYKNSGDTKVKAVLAIGLDGDGNGVTGQSTNDYFLIDFNTLENRVYNLEEEGGDAAEQISGISNTIENIIESLGFESNGSLDWHRHPEDLNHLYPDATDVHNLLSLMIDDIKKNLNENLSLEFDGTDIILSNGDEEICTLSADEFVKDGILEEVDVINDESERSRDPEGHDVPVPYILFKWNSDAGDTYSRIQLGKIFNPYTNGDGLNLEGNEFSIKIDSGSSEFLSVERGGLKVTGVTDAIRTAAAAATTKVEQGANNAHVFVATRNEADNSKTYVISDEDIASNAELQAEKADRREKETNLNSLISNEISARTELTGTILDRISGLTDNDERLAHAIQDEVEQRQTLSATTHDLGLSLDALSAKTIEIQAQGSSTEDDLSDLSDEVDSVKDRVADLEETEISGVDPNDKMLTIANHIISATFRTEYDSESKEIKFYGKNDSVLGTISTSDFVIDGMINTVSVVEESGVKYLRFVFNTDAGKQDIDIPLLDLVTPYTVKDGSGAFLVIEDYQIGVKTNTTDGSGLATERQVHNLEDIVGDGFNEPGDTHTLTQKVVEIEERLNDTALDEDVEELQEEVSAIKAVLAKQFKLKTVLPSATVKLSFYGVSGDYILVGSQVTPIINIQYNDGQYVEPDGTTSYALNEINNSNSKKELFRDGVGYGPIPTGDTVPSETIKDGDYSASADIYYLDGSADPIDVFGEVDESVRIHAGSIHCESNVIKAFRPVYYGIFDPADYAEVTAAVVKDMLTGFTCIETYDWLKDNAIKIMSGAKAFVIAVPSDNDRFVGGEIKAILDNKDHGFNIIDQFVTYNLSDVKTYTGEAGGYNYVAYVYQPLTEMEESYFKVIY